MRKFLIFILLVFTFSSSFSQNEDEKKAFDILDKAIGFIFNEQNGAIYYEGLTFGIDNPLDIFTLPVYDVYRGGFWIWDKNKQEMQLGVVKSLCDGKLMVVIDEISKTMVVDSLRRESPLDIDENPDIDKLLKETFGEGELKNIGKENVNGRLCHKIRADFNDMDIHVIYWIEVQTNKLYLMAEYQENAYDVYWIKNITKAPVDYNYTVNLPKQEMENFHGYQVYDLRFTRDMLNNKNY